MPATLGELATRFGLELRGDPDAQVDGVATLQNARPGSVSFLANPKYRRYLKDTAATVVVVEPAIAPDCSVAALLSTNPYVSYARIAAYLLPSTPAVPGVHPSAVIAADVRIPATATIGPHCTIGARTTLGERVVLGAGCIVDADVQIGADTRLVARVTLYRDVTIGARCLIHAGVVIGSDGFGLARDRDGWVKVPQVGGVRIGDDVEIGANTTIDRGAIDDTVIGNGVKLDNQIQVGHNVRIGDHTAIAGCVGISGSTTIGKRCLVGGAVGFVGHLEVGDDVVITGLTMVNHSLTGPGVYSSGLPAQEGGAWRRVVARLRHLDELFDRVRRLEKSAAGTLKP